MTKIASATSKSPEMHRALADADDLFERAAARLVTHVRAVGQVVRAVAAREELIEERRLVARASRRIEDRFVRCRDLELLADEREGVVPIDRRVVRCALFAEHGLHEASLRVEPFVGARSEIFERVLREEVSTDVELGRFVGDVLDAVFAELEEVAFVLGLGPRAAGAVEAVVLVQTQERARAAQEAHRPRNLEARRRRAEARRFFGWLLDAELAQLLAP